jgi:hypothetical protein
MSQIPMHADSPYALGLILASAPDMDFGTEYEEDWGYADDGWPRPGPCPVCGAPDWTCVTDAHYTYTMAEIDFVTSFTPGLPPVT